MDFLERISSLSPDGGSGATELLLLLSVLVCGMVAAVVRLSGTCRVVGELEQRSHAE